MDIDTFILRVPVGRENAVSLKYLSTATRIPERTVRRMIEDVNKSGKKIIVNLSDGKGYFVPDDTEKHLERLYKAQESRRFMSLKDKLEGMNAYLDAKKPSKEGEMEKNQISIFDLIGRTL